MWILGRGSRHGNDNDWARTVQKRALVQPITPGARCIEVNRRTDPRPPRAVLAHSMMTLALRQKVLDDSADRSAVAVGSGGWCRQEPLPLHLQL